MIEKGSVKYYEGLFEGYCKGALEEGDDVHMASRLCNAYAAGYKKGHGDGCEWCQQLLRSLGSKAPGLITGGRNDGSG